MIFNKFKSHSNNTLRRFKTFYEQGDFVIGFITDVHTGGNTHYKHYKYFFDLAKNYNTNLLINGGDIGLGLGEDEITANQIIQNTVKCTKTNIPYIFIKGNHDCGSKPFTTKELYDKLMPIEEPGIEVVRDGGYGKYININSKIVIVFLNTSDTNYASYIIKEKQIRWFIDTLEKIPNGYRVIIASHFCMDEIGFWKRSVTEQNYKLPESISFIQQIIYDFKDHKKGNNSLNNVSFDWDFTKKDNSILFELAGDSHFDNYINRDGINIVVREGYGGVLPEDVYDGGKHYKFSANEGIQNVTDCLFDIVCVKPNNKVKVFRIGVGDAEADLSF